MGRFDARAFADTAGAFNARAEKELRSWFGWKARPAVASGLLPVSKFVRLQALLLRRADFTQMILPLPAQVPVEEQKPFYSHFFATPSPAKAPLAEKIEAVASGVAMLPEIKAEAPAAAVPSPRKILTLKGRKTSPVKNLTALFRKEMGLRPRPVMPVVPEMPVPATPANQDQKPRKTLTLKNKVELPAFVNITRSSSATDLASAFKAEMKVITERNIPATAKDVVADLHAAFAEKRRHPLAQKSWKELMAEAQAYPQSREEKNFDLGAAFRREMQALLATESKTGTPHFPVPAKPKAFAA